VVPRRAGQPGSGAATGAHRSAVVPPVRSRRFRGDSGGRARRLPRLTPARAAGSDPGSAVPRPGRRHMVRRARWRSAHAASLAPASRERVGRRHVRALAWPFLSPEPRTCAEEAGGGGWRAAPRADPCPEPEGAPRRPGRQQGGATRHLHLRLHVPASPRPLPCPPLPLFPDGVVSARLR
jgi:hypothetical protein